MSNTFLIVGESTTGKTASLAGLDDEGMLYLSCESGKKAPFRNAKCSQKVIIDPMDVPAYIKAAEDVERITTIVIDSLTYLMNRYESMYVLSSKDTQRAWGTYTRYFQDLMQEEVANSTKNIIFLAHTHTQLDEVLGQHISKVPVKGALSRITVESFFDVIVSTRKMPIKVLKEYPNDMLVITPEEEALGLKYVYQTMLTKETIHERIRAPHGMWEVNETFIDNKAEHILARLNEYQ